MPLVQATDVPIQPFPTGRTSPQAPDVYQRIATEPSMFGSLEGQALEKFGAGAEKLGGVLATEAIRGENLHNQVAARELANSSQDKANDLLSGLHALKGKEALDAIPDITAQIRKAYSDARGNLQNPSQQIHFDGQTRHLLNLQLAEIRRHYDAQQLVYAKTTNDAGYALGQQGLAAHADDPVAADAYVKKMMDAKLAELQLVGGQNDPDQINAALGTVRADVTAELAKNLGARDAIAAANYVERNKDVLGVKYPALAEHYRERAIEQLGRIAGNQAVGGPAGGPAGGAQPSQPTASKNLENFNFGNMKAVGGGWRTFPNEEEGAKAIGDWLVRHHAGGQTTIRQLIDDPERKGERGYAPESDPGNAGKELVEKAAKRVGVDPDAKIDMNDPALRRKMVGAIVQQEFENTQITQRVLAAYDRAQGGAAAPAPTVPAAIEGYTAPSAKDIAALRADPQSAQKYDQTFGPGAAQLVLQPAPAIPPPAAPPPPPKSLEQIVTAARNNATQLAQRNNFDPAATQKAVDHAESVARTQYNNSTAVIRQAEQNNLTLAQAQVTAGNNGEPFHDHGEFMADPGRAQLYNGLSPQHQKTIRDWIETAATKKPLTPERLARYEQLRGMSQESPDQFLQVDVLKEDLPRNMINQLITRRNEIAKGVLAPPDVTKAMTILQNHGLFEGTGIDKANNPPRYHQYYSALSDAIQQFKIDKKRAPNNEEILSIGNDLMKVAVPGALWGLFAPTRQYQTIIPNTERDAIVKGYQSATGKTPTPNEILRIYHEQQRRKTESGERVAPVPPAEPEGMSP